MMVTKFDRKLSSTSLAVLEKQPWCRHLLDYRFTDVSDREQPLFLAIRKNYLNAYVDGQSVLKIKFDARYKLARLRAEIHHKYVYDTAEGQVYLDVTDEKGGDKPYVGKIPLDEWVKRARTLGDVEKRDEKRGVTVIIGRNAHVIDVEMALPDNRTGDPRHADRIDIVALEKDGEALKIVFYEAKGFWNRGALRANNLRPEVLGQLKRYEDWLKSPGRS